ncbi:hypothetical protein HYY69_04595 [Candidatus Woesearchaeota archaeon]|nr:hypothetical protein [Candidatus Woesearchaeota archaeon]
MKCIICGKKAEHEVLCEKCHVDKYTAIVSFTKFDLKICGTCNAYMYGKSWHPPLKLEQAVRKAFYDSTKFHKKPQEYEAVITLPKHEVKIGNKVVGKVIVTIKTSISNSIKEETMHYPLKIRYTRCDNCSKNMSGYFQGVLQLRNDKSKQFAAAADFIRKKTAEKKGVEITKEDPVKNGIDFYITSKAYLNTLGKIVSNQFGAELKVAAELFTQDKQTSKEVYRTNLLIRLPQFNIGDVISLNRKLILIKTIRDKSVEGIDLKTNKYVKEHYLGKEYEIVAASDDFLEADITRKKPFLEILDPKTYQPVKVENEQVLEPQQDKVSVVCINDRWYLVQ